MSKLRQFDSDDDIIEHLKEMRNEIEKVFILVDGSDIQVTDANGKVKNATRPGAVICYDDGRKSVIGIPQAEALINDKTFKGLSIPITLVRRDQVIG